jgi:hypothetical protein
MSSNIAPDDPRNGSNIDPMPPKNEPGLDRARKDIRERHEKHIDKVRRENPPSNPVGPGGNQ